MKKIKKLLVLIVLFLLIIFIYKLTIKRFNVSYKIKKHNIEEYFYIKNKKHIYNIKIDNKYTYTIIKNFNKRKKIINNIKEYKKIIYHVLYLYILKKIVMIFIV